ncbi:hypothetical protein BB558_005853 [Smittium angustum]|uniref:DDE-1 domain-containing protein n=1 Tax=Smittium angustum TaxID=133377 RepID=A0A2U1IZ96_SMIAN|nr:hypothetical protein BB558_005853 [Smittium angustum]
MDKSGVQLNNVATALVVTKGLKVANQITSGEKGETGVRKVQEFEMDFPPGSKVVMNKRTGYSNSEVFKDWLKTHFIPRNTHGKILLILDGHGSHCADVSVLE